MSFSGGVFSINSSGQPVVTGTTISSTVFNAFTADIATGLSTCMLKDGTQTATASIPFAVGITGTTTNDNAAAGSVGQLIESTVLSASAVPLTSTVAANVTSISLTAGDWDVWGTVNFKPAGSTTIATIEGWTNTASATEPTAPNTGSMAYLSASFTTGQPQAISVGKTRTSLSGTTTIYLGAIAAFGASTMGAFGYIGARRRR